MLTEDVLYKTCTTAIAIIIIIIRMNNYEFYY